MIPDQKERKVEKMPTPLEMLSYVFFCCGCLCGPFYEYSDYINFIEKRAHYAKIPVSIWQSLVRLFHGLLCLAFNLIVGQYFWVQFCGTEEFTTYSFPYKVMYYFTQNLLQNGGF